MATGVASLLTALVLYDPQADPDLFARTAVGRLIEVSGGVTDQDPFAFTPRSGRAQVADYLRPQVFRPGRSGAKGGF